MDAPAAEQALSGQDYVTTQQTVDMVTGVTRVPVEIPILAVSIHVHCQNHSVLVCMKSGGRGPKLGRCFCALFTE